ncbi:MAG: cupin domain-containing protein [Acidimicrobiia bacterium]|nr:cupin domain-containing protein [Acidimicrobiia bacterium]
MNTTMQDLIRAELAASDDLEVVMSVVELPAGVSLPVHTHPGEEFAYVMEGSLVLWEEGKGDLVVRAGDSAKVPLGVVHTVRTEQEGCKIIVFRVHTAGQPERTLVDASG